MYTDINGEPNTRGCNVVFRALQAIVGFIVDIQEVDAGHPSGCCPSAIDPQLLGIGLGIDPGVVGQLVDGRRVHVDKQALVVGLVVGDRGEVTAALQLPVYRAYKTTGLGITVVVKGEIAGKGRVLGVRVEIAEKVRPGASRPGSPIPPPGSNFSPSIALPPPSLSPWILRRVSSRGVSITLVISPAHQLSR